jgi:hypothetical protein
MGLLDDAIREHLELKRRRGADPGEIEREESEALGPVRREAPSGESAAPEAAGSYADHEPAALDEPGAAFDDFDFGDAPAAPAAFQDHQAADADLDLDRPVRSEPPVTHDAPYAEREDESATPPHGDPLAYQQTREFSATELGEALGHHDDAPAPAAPPAPPAYDDVPAPAPSADVVPADEDADDVDPEDELEDTPDFLQETPEHDRLWFEQKPPKDFDF